ncbi:MAG: NAD-glutamate dehydrogenase, partial [Acidimicrobiia bacterium]|nr:NAD-glutamate dehydrogenase [Acidimicrobiia bacterium]
ERISLTSIMPTLGNLGINVLDERPYEIEVDDGEPIWIYDFALEHGNPLPFDRMADLIEATFTTVWAGDVVDDGFNQLVLAAGIDCRDVAIFRAYARYLRQIGAPYSQLYLQQTLTTRAGITCLLLELFRARFDPDQGATDDMIEERRGSLSEAIDLVDVLDEDRILRRFANLIDATLRTTRYQLRDGRPNPYLAFKLEPTAIDEMPMPRPRYEIFVYSPRLEGVHLRAGAVARGGLRWSDRLEDYRTEVLGLAKAQMVKNAVIVPVGAKGGFILKQPPTDPALAREEAVAGYRLFVGALLDLTDNLVDGEVVPPDRTIRYDGDDPYLVVAADKGTATLSDVANEIATSRGFWLGDAFASGGSNGYDHKQMAITARGAWESVNRHFRELGIDVETTDFTAVGIGDMSGDVFGNGMLRSPHTRLVAAFDHRHVFVDPNPDAASSFQERSRLFALGRSSWADYDTELLSPGGAVFDRRAKSVELSPEIQAALDVDAANMTPDRLISAVLRAPVDLLWNGGIGTYVKASDESHAEVGDKSNDAIRVDAASLRCRVIGEGGNLGITQQGRIEFARAGGRIYTDAIDNAGGVDCSDHEVNLKILLDRVVADGELTVKQRNQLLDEMTAEVAQQVLAGNYAQTQALSTDRVESASLIDVHRRHIASLEARGLLDRRLEGLPDAEEVAERRSAGEGLTTPELAILLAYTKNILGDELLASAVPDDRAFERLLADYFPEPVRERFAPYVTSHPLRREIIANRITNRVVDRGGITMVYRLSKESSVRSVDIAAAHLAAWEIFDLEQLWSDVIDLDGQVAAGTQLSIFLAGRQLAERATRWLVRNRNLPLDATSAVADLAAKVRDTMINLSDWLLGADRRAFFRTVDELTRASVPIELAERTALLGHSIAALDIVSASDVTNAPISTVASVHFAVAELMDLTWIRDQILALPRDTEMETLARLGLRGDLYLDHKSLTELVTNSGDGWVDGDDLTAVERVEVWVGNHQEPVARYREAVTNIKATSLTDLTALLVASREVRTLIRRVGQNNSA